MAAAHYATGRQSVGGAGRGGGFEDDYWGVSQERLDSTESHQSAPPTCSSPIWSWDAGDEPEGGYGGGGEGSSLQLEGSGCGDGERAGRGRGGGCTGR